MRGRWKLVGAAVPLLAVGAVALAGGFAGASDRLTEVKVGETHRTARVDIAVHRAWVSTFRPDEPRKYAEPKRRLFVEAVMTNRGFQSEGVIHGDSWGDGPAPQVLVGDQARKFEVSTDAVKWENRSTFHPGVTERVVLELPWPDPTPERVRLRLDEYRETSNMLIPRYWKHLPGSYVDVPIGPEPAPVTK